MTDHTDARTAHPRLKPFDPIPVSVLGADDTDSVLAGVDTEAVYRREAPDLFRYLQRQVRDDADAADLLSEVFVVAWRRSGDMPSDARQARRWLFGVARRTASTHRRSTVRRSQLVDRLRDELSTRPGRWSDANSDRVAEQDLRADAVRDAMLRLRPADREILAIVHWHDFTLVEAAAILGIRPGAARTRYQRARERIARDLGDYASHTVD